MCPYEREMQTQKHTHTGRMPVKEEEIRMRLLQAKEPLRLPGNHLNLKHKPGTDPSPSAFRGRQLCEFLSLRLLASRIMRQYVFVV